MKDLLLYNINYNLVISMNDKDIVLKIELDATQKLFLLTHLTAYLKERKEENKTDRKVSVAIEISTIKSILKKI